LEEKNESSEKYFGSLGKWCKTKKLGDKKCKTHRSIGENFKIPGSVPTPPYLLTTALLCATLREFIETTYEYL
jgi:hypothetical protein